MVVAARPRVSRAGTVWSNTVNIFTWIITNIIGLFVGAIFGWNFKALL
jgi:hypothetical protein